MIDFQLEDGEMAYEEVFHGNMRLVFLGNQLVASFHCNCICDEDDGGSLLDAAVSWNEVTYVCGGGSEKLMPHQICQEMTWIVLKVQESKIGSCNGCKIGSQGFQHYRQYLPDRCLQLPESLIWLQMHLLHDFYKIGGGAEHAGGDEHVCRNRGYTGADDDYDACYLD